MKLNHLEDFKSKIAAGKICQGLVVQLADPVVGELAGEAGFDFTWIDAEHCPHTLQTIQNLVLAQRGTGCAPFVRRAVNPLRCRCGTAHGISAGRQASPG